MDVAGDELLLMCTLNVYRVCEEKAQLPHAMWPGRWNFSGPVVKDRGNTLNNLHPRIKDEKVAENISR